MRCRPNVALALTVVLLATVGAPTFAAATVTPVLDAQEQPETDNTVTRITIDPDGDARWAVRIRTRLDTQERVEQYRAFQERFRANTSRYLDPFQTRISGVVRTASNTTGREMVAENFSASTTIQELPRRWGVVTYEFTWTAFAESSDGELIVGDVFDGGFFIAANDSLEVVSPDGHRVGTVAPAADETESGIVRWEGRTDFPDGQPRVVFAPVGAQTRTGEGGGPSDAPANGTADATPTAFSDTGGNEWVLWVALAGALALAGGGLVLYLRRRDGTGDGVPEGPTEATAGGATDEANTTTGPGADVPDEAPPSRIRTDPDRVLELLREHGGRMRQADIGDELGWSASKVSRVVSDMSEDGRVEKLRLGRENVIDLPDDGGSEGADER